MPEKCRADPASLEDQLAKAAPRSTDKLMQSAQRPPQEIGSCPFRPATTFDPVRWGVMMAVVIVAFYLVVAVLSDSRLFAPCACRATEAYRPLLFRWRRLG